MRRAYSSKNGDRDKVNMLSIDNHRRLQVCFMFVAAAVILLSPLWSRRNSNDPVWWMYGTLVVYFVTAIIYWHRFKQYTKQPASRRCPVCEYELVKQIYGDLCPECGLRLEPGEREQLWDARLRMLKGEPNEYQATIGRVLSRHHQ